MQVVENFSILTSISWNSNSWKGNATTQDLENSKYDWVIENKSMHEDLNFAYDLYPAENDNYFIAYTPKFKKKKFPIKEKTECLRIIFFWSTDYENHNKKYIVGIYGFPLLATDEKDKYFIRQAKHKIYRTYNSGNIKAKVDNIIFLKKFLEIDNNKCDTLELLPNSKLISQQGFNYLNSENVQNILSQIIALNPYDKKLISFLNTFPLKVENVEIEDAENIVKDYSTETLKGIVELENKMRKLKPQLKERISIFIERGTIASKAKKITGNKCLVCEALGTTALGFKKDNGTNYIEAHHVIPVSKNRIGSLSLTNIITVCANHHRQMHYGNVEIITQTEKYFKFRIDMREININKIKIN